MQLELIKRTLCLFVAIILTVTTNCGGGGSSGSEEVPKSGGSATGGVRNPVCAEGQSSGEVERPQFVMNLPGQTSWYASPLIVDLDDDGNNELIAAYYSVYVFANDGTLLDRIDGNSGRVYAPHVVADLEGDGKIEVVFGNRHEIYAYEWTGGKFDLKDGWPADTTTAGESPEVRGLAVAESGF